MFAQLKLLRYSDRKRPGMAWLVYYMHKADDLLENNRELLLLRDEHTEFITVHNCIMKFAKPAGRRGKPKRDDSDDDSSGDKSDNDGSDDDSDDEDSVVDEDAPDYELTGLEDIPTMIKRFWNRRKQDPCHPIFYPCLDPEPGPKSYG